MKFFYVFSFVFFFLLFFFFFRFTFGQQSKSMRHTRVMGGGSRDPGLGRRDPSQEEQNAAVVVPQEEDERVIHFKVLFTEGS